MIDTLKTETARGESCARCRCCRAVIAFDGEFLCAACDDGTHPCDMIEPRGAAAPAAPQPKEEASPLKISNEVLEAARGVDWSKETAAEVARRLGVAPHLVYYAKAKLGKAKAKPAAKCTLMKPAAAPQAPAGDGKIPITINLSASALNAWWDAQSASTKADIFARRIELSL
jgi:predicted DNA-binding protein (UPF0251 family)